MDTTRCSMADVARKAGVSKNTVSLALRKDPQIPASTRSRIEKIAERMGYLRNPKVAQLMAELRGSRSPRFRAPLALLNANIDRDAFRKHPTIPTYVEGCRRRATELGYSLDEFWLHDPKLDGGSLSRILRARGIHAAVAVGLMEDNRLPARFLPVWKQFPTVVTGVRTVEPTLSFACTDHHALAKSAFENALRLGYRRPALVLDHIIDQLVEGRFTAGTLVAQQTLPESSRTNPFTLVMEARRDPSLFVQWFQREKPDLILTLYNVVWTWLREMRLSIPNDVGLIQLEWRRDRPEWAGMNQHNDLVGEAAIDMAIGMLHRGESTIPAFPRATLIGSTWIEGTTVRSLRDASAQNRRKITRTTRSA